MPATSKNVLFPGHNQLLTAGTIPQAIVSVGSQVFGTQFFQSLKWSLEAGLNVYISKMDVMCKERMSYFVLHCPCALGKKFY